MTNTLTLAIETEEFNNLLKSIQTRLNNLDDKKYTPITKKPFMPNMLVSKMVMMSRPTYPYIQEIKDMVRYANIAPLAPVDFHFPIMLIKRYAGDGKRCEPTWFNKYHYYKSWSIKYHYLKHQGNRNDLADEIFTNLLGHDYDPYNENIYPMQEPGLYWKKSNVKGYAKTYGKKKLTKAIGEWILDGTRMKTNMTHRDAYLRFVKTLEAHIKDIFHHRPCYADSPLYYEHEESASRSAGFVYKLKATWFPLEIKFIECGGQVSIVEMRARGETFDDFHD